MRGKPTEGSFNDVNDRNIPAYAGKTQKPCSPPWCASEHPRVCGENKSLCADCPMLHGTSPRMRGKPYTVVDYCYSGRNIPAYAGKTGAPPDTPRLHSEHPRVCGENAVRASVMAGISGTSPRMRGKHGRSRAQPRRSRNIPAYAGKTWGRHWGIP